MHVLSGHFELARADLHKWKTLGVDYLAEVSKLKLRDALHVVRREVPARDISLFGLITLYVSACNDLTEVVQCSCPDTVCSSKRVVAANRGHHPFRASHMITYLNFAPTGFDDVQPWDVVV